jgi:hypothetical protein
MYEKLEESQKRVTGTLLRREALALCEKRGKVT